MLLVPGSVAYFSVVHNILSLWAGWSIVCLRLLDIALSSDQVAQLEEHRINVFNDFLEETETILKFVD